MENEDVVGTARTGAAPITSEWPTILLPTKVPLLSNLFLTCHVCSEHRDPIETIIKCSLYLCCQGQQFLIQYSDVTTDTHRIIYDVTQKGSTGIVASYSMIFHAQIGVKLIWARSQRCGCLVTLFCYQLIAKPVNKIAALSRDLTHIPQWISTLNTDIPPHGIHSAACENTWLSMVS